MPAMNPISSAELSALRSEVPAAACDTSCIIKRPTKTADAYGSSTEVFNTVNTINVGLKQPTAGQAQAYDYLIGNAVAWMVKFPVGTDVRIDDHLVIGSMTMVVQANLALQSYSFLDTYLAVVIQ